MTMSSNTMRFANESLNRLDREGLEKFQETRLLRQIEYVYGSSDFYRRRFAAVGVDPVDIRTLDDYRALPILMDKEQERLAQAESLERYGHPFGAHLCCPVEDVGLTATTSGTTGDPTFTYTLSRSDMHTMSPAMRYMLAYAGVGAGDRMLFSYALGVYATSAAMQPIRDSGVLPIDVDVRGGAEMIAKFTSLTRPSAAMMTPSLAQHLVGRIPELLGRTPAELGWRALFTVGEIAVGIPEVKAYLEQSYGCRVYDWIAPAGQTLAFSCDSDEYHGMHAISPDLDLYPLDLVDPETRDPVALENGAIGEAVYTSLQRRALPLLRYASGDIVQIFTEPCPGCGFTGARVKIVGRSDDMLIVKGTNVYPGAIKNVLAQFVPEVTGEMRVVLNAPPPQVVPPLIVRVEHGPDTRADELDGLAERIRSALSRTLKVGPQIEWLPPGGLDKPLAKTPLFVKNY